MKTYTVNFASDAEVASHVFDAQTPEQALALARKLYEDEPSELWFEPYDGMDVNEIIVYDADGNEVAVWYDDDRRLGGASAHGRGRGNPRPCQELRRQHQHDFETLNFWGC